MEKETRILDLKGKFVNGDVINMDFKEIKGFAPEIHRIMTPKEWQEKRQKILKMKLP